MKVQWRWTRGSSPRRAHRRLRVGIGGVSGDQQLNIRVRELPDRVDQVGQVLIRAYLPEREDDPRVRWQPEPRPRRHMGNRVRVARVIRAMRDDEARAVAQGGEAPQGQFAPHIAERDETIEPPHQRPPEFVLRVRITPFVRAEIVDRPNDLDPARPRDAQQEADDERQRQRLPRSWQVEDRFGPVEMPDVVAPEQQPLRIEIIDAHAQVGQPLVEERIIRILLTVAECGPRDDAQRVPGRDGDGRLRRGPRFPPFPCRPGIHSRTSDGMPPASTFVWRDPRP